MGPAAQLNMECISEKHRGALTHNLSIEPQTKERQDVQKHTNHILFGTMPQSARNSGLITCNETFQKQPLERWRLYMLFK